MWTPTIRLEATDLDTLELDPSAGWFPQRVDFGSPVVRETVSDAPDTNGSIDTTSLIGGRTVQVPLVIDHQLGGGSVWAMRQQLLPFLYPWRRCKLIGTVADGGPEIQVVLRGVKWRDGGLHMRTDDEALLQWWAPSGLLELAGDLHYVEANPGGEQPQTGLTFDATPDFSFGGATQASGGAVANNIGKVPVWPTLQLFGPFTGPMELLNTATGGSLNFLASLSIVAGDWLRINTATREIVNSAGQSYYDALDVASSDWQGLQLQPGSNRIYMLPDTFTSPPASFRIEWRPAWL